MITSLSLKSIADTLQQGGNVSFVKLGDGEQECMNGVRGQNCDGTPYTFKLAQGLMEAFKYLSAQPDVCVAEFKNQKVFNILLHRRDNNLEEVRDFYVGIRNLKRPKVFVGPANLVPVSVLLMAEFICVHSFNAFADYHSCLEECKKLVKDNAIFMFSCGMTAKVLIADLHKYNTSISCLDMGSAFDPLYRCKSRTGQATRGQLLELYKGLI